MTHWGEWNICSNQLLCWARCWYKLDITLALAAMMRVTRSSSQQAGQISGSVMRCRNWLTIISGQSSPARLLSSQRMKELTLYMPRFLRRYCLARRVTISTTGTIARTSSQYCQVPHGTFPLKKSDIATTTTMQIVNNRSTQYSPKTIGWDACQLQSVQQEYSMSWDWQCADADIDHHCNSIFNERFNPLGHWFI